MNEDKILRALGGIDERYVDEAERFKKSRVKKPLIAIATIAASAAVILGGALLVRSRLSATTPIDQNNSHTEVWQIKHWDEKTTPERYDLLNFGGNEYNSSLGGVVERGEYLSTAQLNGYDEYEEKSYTITAEIYEQTGIDTQCAVVVAFSGGEEYIYCNSLYKPATLGEFIGALDLRSTLKINSAHADSYYDSGWSVTEYSGVSTQAVLDILFADESVENIKNFDEMYFDFGRNLVDFAIDVDKIGAKNISLSLTEEGWLTTNILATGKAFYLGKDKMTEVLAYLQTCEHSTQSYTYDDAQGGTFSADSSEMVAEISVSTCVTDSGT